MHFLPCSFRWLQLVSHDLFPTLHLSFDRRGPDAMSFSTPTPYILPTGLAPVAGLPPRRTSSRTFTITCPRLSATLRALTTSIEIKRATCTTLAYTDQLLAALRLIHPLSGHRSDEQYYRDSPQPWSSAAYLDHTLLAPHSSVRTSRFVAPQVGLDPPPHQLFPYRGSSLTA